MAVLILSLAGGWIWRERRHLSAAVAGFDRALPVGDRQESVKASNIGFAHQAEFAEAMDGLPVGLISFDAAGRVRFSNHRYREMIEWEGPPLDQSVTFADLRARTQQRTVEKLVDEDSGSFEARVVAASRPEGCYQVYRNRNGDIVAAFDRTTQDGGLVGVRFAMTWLDERQRQLDAVTKEVGQTAAALERESKKLRSIASLAPFGAWEYDAGENGIIWDDVALEIIGFSQDSRPNPDQFLALCAPPSREVLVDNWRRAVRTRSNFECDVELMNGGGEPMWLRIIGAPVVEEADIVRITGVIRDITLEKRQSEALRIANEELHDAMTDLSHAEKRFFDIAAVSTDWFWENDKYGRFIYVSGSYERETGADPNKMIGRTRAEMLDMHGPGHRNAADWDWLEAKIAAREPFSDFVYLNFTFDRECDPTWVRISGAPFFDETGAFAGYRGVGSNVTNLYSSMRRAEEANEAKSAFLATMSHEIRTPLNGVLGLAEELESRIEDPEQGRLIASIRESGAHLLSVINDILDVSKIEAGRLELEDEPFHLDELLRRIYAVHVPLAEEKGLTFRRVSVDECAGVWRGDAHRVMQILHNLVGNAIKFTEAGAVEISCSCASPPPGVDGATGEGDGEAVPGFVLTVSDTGVGMDQERLVRAFERFSQGDASTTRRYGGAGLGLSIAHDLADAMGGRIEVQSTIGVGTIVNVHLPLMRASPETPRRELIAEVPPAGLKILAADDNATNRMLMELLLKKANLDVTIVEGGEEAVEAAAAHRFDIILMDIAMPGMDGTEALKTIRAAEAKLGRRTPAVAVTANVLSHQVAEYLSLGFDGHIAKPIQRAALMTGICRVLASAAPRAAE